MGHRQQLLGMCGLLVLHYQLYHVPDRRIAKQVWDIHKKVRAEDQLWGEREKGSGCALFYMSWLGKTLHGVLMLK